jgi:hypothetical protein
LGKFEPILRVLNARKNKIQPLILAFLEKLYIEIVINDNRNILYETDFFISKNWRLYFFFTDLLNFFFIFQSPEQIWGACPKFLGRLPNPRFFSFVMVYGLTIRHLFELEMSFCPSFLGFWAKKHEFFEKARKNCNLDRKH